MIEELIILSLTELFTGFIADKLSSPFFLFGVFLSSFFYAVGSSVFLSRPNYGNLKWALFYFFLSGTAFVLAVAGSP